MVKRRLAPSVFGRPHWPRHRCCGSLIALALLLPLAGWRAAHAAEEPPLLVPEVAAGRLPPLAERLPLVPRRDLPQRADWRPGRYGGSLTMLSRGGRDPRDMVILGYARLVAWDERYRLVPDILESYEVEEGRIFTLHLRPGHRWSDGAEFTTEDFRFWWQDLANHPELSPAGPPAALLADGRPPRVEILDRRAIRFSWDQPNGRFLPALAGAAPPFIYRPAHYLKAFHPRFADPDKLARDAGAAGLPSWAAAFHRRDRPFRFDNPERPTLQPWVNRTEPPSERFVGARNPYFHRVDGAGRQLPYIDRLIVAKSDRRLIAAKAAAGETSLQATGLGLRDFTLLKEAEADGTIKVRLWPIGRGTQLALYPNLTVKDSSWRLLLREPNFRRALSLAIDRARIVKVVFQGLGKPAANSVLAESPLFRPAYRKAWASFDPDRANRLLDRQGLTERDSDGVRLAPGGQRLELVVVAGDSDPAEVDVLELIALDWRRIGIELLIRSTGRRAFRRDLREGRAPMSIFYGLANGLARPAMRPDELAPVNDRQGNWPLWGLHADTRGRAGEAPDIAEVLRLQDLLRRWDRAGDDRDRESAWAEMLAIHADQVFSIGLVGGLAQPVVTDARLRNLPSKAYFMYDPGAYFGLTRPDTYYFE